jgi:hypothetical protein
MELPQFHNGEAGNPRQLFDTTKRQLDQFKVSWQEERPSLHYILKHYLVSRIVEETFCLPLMARVKKARAISKKRVQIEENCSCSKGFQLITFYC